MSLELHPKCRVRLIELLVEALGRVEVQYGNFLAPRSWRVFESADQVLPSSGSWSEKAASYIGDDPITTFVVGELNGELQDHCDFDRDAKLLPLTEIERFADLGELASRLVSRFESLPHRYRFTFKVASEFVDLTSGSEIEIAENIRLLTPDNEFVAAHPLLTGVDRRDDHLFGTGLLNFRVEDKWDTDSAYLQVTERGYMGKWVSSATLERVQLALKSFLGLSVATGAFVVTATSESKWLNMRMHVHQESGSSWEIRDLVDVDGDLRTALRQMKAPVIPEPFNLKEHRIQFLRSCLGGIAIAFSKSTYGERILQASRWIADSHLGRNELLSFVQSMVALEILLGDKAVSDLVGLGELLRNRCAYLVGTSRQQREEILRDFAEIYNIRSKIVHRGQEKLKQRERDLFYKLRWLANRAVQREIAMLRKDD